MAGKPKPMSQIKQLLQLHQQGKSIKFIARSLGISKNTVKAYLAKDSMPLKCIHDLLALEDPVMEASSMQETLLIKKNVSSILKPGWTILKRT